MEEKKPLEEEAKNPIDLSGLYLQAQEIAKRQEEIKNLKRQHKKVKQLFRGSRSYNPKRIKEREDFYNKYTLGKEVIPEENQ